MVAPPFGTASAYRDAFPNPPPDKVTINAETCYNLGVFKDMVRQYRKLDDQIIVRLNRAQAQLRDQARLSPSASASQLEGVKGAEKMCSQMWQEMMTGWTHRQTLLTYCLQTVTSSLDAKRAETRGVDPHLAAPSSAHQAGFRNRGVAEEEAVEEQLSNEQSIEAIIRKRALDAFRSRCPFFTPPTNTASRAWWELADSGRPGRGPDVP